MRDPNHILFLGGHIKAVFVRCFTFYIHYIDLTHFHFSSLIITLNG